MKKFIAFRLRKELDADLIALGIEENMLPELCRNGLRLMLGIQTAKQVEVKEKQIIPLSEPKPQQPQRATTGQTMRRTLADAQKQTSTTKPYVPNQNLGRV